MLTKLILTISISFLLFIDTNCLYGKTTKPTLDNDSMEITPPIDLDKFSVRLIGACRGKNKIKLGELTIKYDGHEILKIDAKNVDAKDDWQEVHSYGVTVAGIGITLIAEARITGKDSDKKRFYVRLRIKAPAIDESTDKFPFNERCED